ncbi:hypothetical protein ABIE51_002373 [Lysobacter sp. OAE881]
MGALRRSHQHADVAEARRQRPDVHAVAHDGVVLADAFDVPDRTQPSSQRDGVHHRRRAGVSRMERSPAGRMRDHRAGAAGKRLQHVLAWQGPQRARAGHRDRRKSLRVARAERLRSLLRVPRRRDQPVVSRPGRGQQIHRPAVFAGRGLSPLARPGRPGAADDPRPEGKQSVQTVVHVALPRARTMRRTTRRRNTSTSTRASSTTATRPIASG